MKDLKEFIKEEIFTTPANTMGMGNPSAPTDTQPVPTRIGMKDLPERPNLRKILSMMKAIRAM